MGFEPLAHRADAPGIDVVDAPRASRSLSDQSRIFQHPQVLGDRRTADRRARRWISRRKGSPKAPSALVAKFPCVMTYGN